ncbi:MAG: glutathione S-transferase family protein [Alphaproteobacteria bacterium]|nr:glutathione S-transferase family protein [Alphaproteobacteria bacterium]
MRLYYDPSSTTCRPVTLFAAEAGIDLDYIPVILFQQEHLQPWFAELNPNQTVPVLVDDGFVLTESSAILKYLADAAGSPAYPPAPKARARVNERMDWFATLFMHNVCYALIYPRVIPHLRMSDATLAEYTKLMQPRGFQRLGVLDAWLAETPYVCGDDITLADYLGVSAATLGELIDFDYSPWPNVQRWIAAMKARPAWSQTQCAFDGWKSAIRTASRGELQPA